MNINQVRHFVGAYESSSFSLAAADHGVTVQAVSKAIGELERELGCKLFARRNRQVSPTPEGAALYQRASKVRDAFAEVEAFRASPDGSEVYSSDDAGGGPIAG